MSCPPSDSNCISPWTFPGPAPYNVCLNSIASEIWDDIGDSNLQIPYIISFLRSSIGSLNLLLATKFTLNSAGEYTPQVGFDEKEVMKLLYLIKYYRNMQTSVLNNINNAGGGLLEMTDDKTKISLINMNEVSKSYNMLLKDLKATLNTYSDYYRRFRAIPTSPCVTSQLSLWTWGTANFYGSSTPGYIPFSQ